MSTEKKNYDITSKQNIKRTEARARVFAAIIDVTEQRLIAEYLSQVAEDMREKQMPEMLTKRTDTENEEQCYCGWAKPGSIETDPVWLIQQVNFYDDDSSILWALTNGCALYNQKWTERKHLVYQ